MDKIEIEVELIDTTVKTLIKNSPPKKPLTINKSSSQLVLGVEKFKHPHKLYKLIWVHGPFAALSSFPDFKRKKDAVEFLEDLEETTKILQIDYKTR